MELCKGTLQDWVVGRNKELNSLVERMVSKKTSNSAELEVLKQITKGLNHLHFTDIIHGDLKPYNILISMPNGAVPPMIKLADFGLSVKSQNGFYELKEPRGTLNWMAPELLNLFIQNFNESNKNNTKLVFIQKSDIFPLGCVFGFVL